MVVDQHGKTRTFFLWYWGIEPRASHARKMLYSTIELYPQLFKQSLTTKLSMVASTHTFLDVVVYCFSPNTQEKGRDK